MRAKSWTQALAVLVTSLGATLLSTAGAAQAAGSLSGTFVLTGGTCAGAGANGTYFRMINPTGNASGPFLDNGDSPCQSKSYTLLQPGTDGGLILGTYQSEASPAFDSAGNSLSKRLIKPVSFFGVNFSGSTNATDPQTKGKTALPTLSADASGKVTGDLRAFAASWNKQEFNQGAPKPDGSKPGITSTPTGTYNASTGALTIQWTSQIVGGPFDKFTGLWHLTGTLRSAGTAPAPASTATTTSAPAAPDATTAGDASAAPSPVSTEAAATASPEPVATATDDATATEVPVAGTTTETASVTRTGSRAPSWVILLVAILGALAVAACFLLDRTIKARA